MNSPSVLARSPYPFVSVGPRRPLVELAIVPRNLFSTIDTVTHRRCANWHCKTSQGSSRPSTGVKAGPEVAAMLSVIKSCRRLAVPVKEYSSTVLPGFATLSAC